MTGFGNLKKYKNSKNKSFSLDYLLDKGIKLDSKGFKSEALKYYELCLKKGLKDATLFCNYGIIKKNFGKLDEAENFLQKSLQLNPNNFIAYSNLGGIFHKYGKFKEAIIYLRRSLEINSNYVESLNLLGNIYSISGNSYGAEILFRKVIKLKPKSANGFYNLALVLLNSFKPKKAETFFRKAIELKSNYFQAYTGLGNTLVDLGNFKEAEFCYKKAIEINSEYVKPYVKLARFKKFQTDTKWQIKLFNPFFEKNKSSKEKIDIFFARASFLHNQEKYDECSKYLKLANDLKLKIIPSKSDVLIKKSRILINESKKFNNFKQEINLLQENIFIVGMPRSGSTLCESILNMNNNVNSLGEVNIFEESFFQFNNNKKNNNALGDIYEIFLKKIKKDVSDPKIITIKWLYNYQYIGLILKKIPNSKIIHCYRNPLDNIISIYQANFGQGIDYSSSLIDTSYVYLDKENTLDYYRKKYKLKIYDLNYDLLVVNPDVEIKKLISWLGWNWSKEFLSPHKSSRPISTASNIQARSNINSESTNRWEKYKSLLQPAIDIFNADGRYNF